jgi:putative FmdB family regulatory protein
VPLYDYDCAACGTRFEVVHGVHADPPATCPMCGKGPVKKAFNLPTIHFKGSGWAKKERRATSAPSASTAKGGEGAPATGGDGSSDRASASSDRGADSGDRGKASSESDTKGASGGDRAASGDGASKPTSSSSAATASSGSSSTD